MAIQRIEGHGDYDDGQGSGGFLGAMAEAAAQGICDIHRKYPALTKLAGSPANEFMLNGILGAMCDRPARGGLPAPPSSPPFTGGQCDGIRYRLTLKGILNRPNFNVQEADSYGAFGPIGGVRSSATESASGKVEVYCRGAFVANSANPVLRPPGWYETGVITSPPPNDRTWSISNATRLSSGQDNCGNPPNDYPITPVNSPDVSRPITVNISPNVGIVVPFAYIPIKPTFEIKPNLTFSPQLQVDIGGLNFNFDAGGVNISLPDVNINPSPIGYPGVPPTSPKPLPPKSPGGNNNPGSGGVECPNPCPEPWTPPLRKFLEINLTKLPTKAQYSSNADESVYFAGWVAFESLEGGYYPRQQVNFRRSVFEFPLGSEAFSLTLTHGAEATTRVYNEEPD